MSRTENCDAQTNSKILGAVGLAAKARKCLIGTELCVESMRANKGKLLLVASDISDGTKKKLVKTAVFHKIPYTLISCSKGELAHAAGKKSDAAAILLNDEGFAKIIDKLGIEIHITDTEVLD